MTNGVTARTRGLSPPTRGNHPDKPVPPEVMGSIPAHAGEPRAPSLVSRRLSVYPRPRGGTDGRLHAQLAWRGLSPPTRGNRQVVGYGASAGRSIPAHAGEPLAWNGERARPRVYPRPRGGTIAATNAARIGFGLSPPTRGNLWRSAARLKRERSIPAHAGEPARDSQERRPPRVYPRPRGGTSFCPRFPFSGRGLSPPTRGNPIGKRRRRC